MTTLEVTCGICGGNNHIEHACPNKSAEYQLAERVLKDWEAQPMDDETGFGETVILARAYMAMVGKAGSIAEGLDAAKKGAYYWSERCEKLERERNAIIARAKAECDGWNCKERWDGKSGYCPNCPYELVTST